MTKYIRSPLLTVLSGVFTQLFIVSSVFAALSAPSTSEDIWQTPKWERSNKKEDVVWKDIRARKVDAEKYLTMFDLVDIALLHSPKTRQAWETARERWANKMNVDGIWYPQATVTYGAQQTKYVQNTKLNDLNQVQFGPAGEITYLLFDFGGRDAKSRGAFYDLLQANFLFNKSVQDLLLDVANAYYNLYAAQAAVVAAKADVDNSGVGLDSANKRYAAGLVSKLDVLQAESNYFSYVYVLENAKGQVKTAKGVLAQTVGLPADAKFRISAPKKQVPTNINGEDISEMINDAMKARPDIAAARASVKSKEQSVKIADAGLLPSINFQTTTDQNGYYYYGASKAWGDDYQFVAFNVALSWDIFDGFSNFAKKRQAQASLALEKARLYQAELAAASDVWAKYFTYRASIKKLKASKAFFNSAKGSYDLALEGYSAGIKSILDLTQAESDLSDARSKLIQSERDLFSSFVQLIHAVGYLTPSDSREAVKTWQTKP
jgi:outer membrane protein TolC